MIGIELLMLLDIRYSVLLLNIWLLDNCSSSLIISIMLRGHAYIPVWNLMNLLLILNFLLLSTQFKSIISLMSNIVISLLWRCWNWVFHSMNIPSSESVSTIILGSLVLFNLPLLIGVTNYLRTFVLVNLWLVIFRN